LSDAAIEQILADFRDWLQQSAEPARPSADGATEPPVDLHTLLGQFIALRHEVHLQTKATRAQQEQNTATLQELRAALDALQDVQPVEEDQPASAEAVRPLLKTLVDLYDALALAERECRRVREATLPALDRLAQAGPVKVPLDMVSQALPFWARWLDWPVRIKAAMDHHAAAAEQPAAAPTAQAVRQTLDSLVTGYTMSLQRIDRALRQHGLEPIETVGRPFDPERMEVVEVVAATERPASEVVGEMRRGYLWQGRVFRFAQVSVAKV
jgi:molecular chaperone GrpE